MKNTYTCSVSEYEIFHAQFVKCFSSEGHFLFCKLEEHWHEFIVIITN